ncbi:SigB/SigF/SigG family RNA polymerase sigma factor [Feifania hominis]|uniref:RNA polymerase sigma factor n=1 Tax=Feifania hominis TaxID=2763660 RepID=A0A926DCS8_9FIRM|nr:SigB/SigF/SigG family RNA polymerase sigma factor [Feifania hominis]MBC8535451.1 SigB/SigF/SigG family RNA polymerase sigma factor [Feifania hominis]
MAATTQGTYGRELLRRAKGGDRAAVEEFVRENFGLVHMAVKRFTGRGVEYDDLFQIGCMGLYKALSNFDLEQGVMFSTYAVPVILGELKRYFRDNGPIKLSRSIKDSAGKIARARERLCASLLREPTVQELAQETEMAVDELVLALDATRPVLSLSQSMGEGDGEMNLLDLCGDDHTDEVIDAIAVREAVRELKERERRVVEMRFYRNMTQMQVASVLGISQVQVSRIEKAVLAKIRESILSES